MINTAREENSAISIVERILLMVVRAMSRFVILDKNNRTIDAVMKETSTITIITLAHGRE